MDYIKPHLEAQYAYKVPASLHDDLPFSTLADSIPDIHSSSVHTVAYAGDVISAGTCLHAASVTCNVALVRCLIACGASVSARDVRGRTCAQLLHDCFVFVKDEHRSNFFRILKILGSKPSDWMTSMTSLAESTATATEDFSHTPSTPVPFASARRLSTRKQSKIQEKLHSAVSEKFDEAADLIGSISASREQKERFVTSLHEIKGALQEQISDVMAQGFSHSVSSTPKEAAKFFSEPQILTNGSHCRIVQGHLFILMICVHGYFSIYYQE